MELFDTHTKILNRRLEQVYVQWTGGWGSPGRVIQTKPFMGPTTTPSSQESRVNLLLTRDGTRVLIKTGMTRVQSLYINRRDTVPSFDPVQRSRTCDADVDPGDRDPCDPIKVQKFTHAHGNVQVRTNDAHGTQKVVYHPHTRNSHRDIPPDSQSKNQWYQEYSCGHGRTVCTRI